MNKSLPELSEANKILMQNILGTTVSTVKKTRFE